MLIDTLDRQNTGVYTDEVDSGGVLARVTVCGVRVNVGVNVGTFTPSQNTNTTIQVNDSLKIFGRRFCQMHFQDHSKLHPSSGIIVYMLDGTVVLVSCVLKSSGKYRHFHPQPKCQYHQPSQRFFDIFRSDIVSIDCKSLSEASSIIRHHHL